MRHFTVSFGMNKFNFSLACSFRVKKEKKIQITCKCGNLIIVHTKNNNKIYLKVLFRMADFKTCDTYTTGWGSYIQSY